MRRTNAATGPFGALLLLTLLGASPLPAGAQSAEHVALVINDNSADSRRIGEYYAAKRGVPGTNVIRLQTSEAERITRAEFDATIHAPIAAAIARAGLHDRILYLVLTRGIPLRIEGTGGLAGTMASVDSELTLLYRRMTGATVPVRGSVPNPYFAGTAPLLEARPFTHRRHDIYLVTRLDAFTVDEAMALVDRGLAPIRDGRIVLDQRASASERAGDDWLAEAAAALSTMGHGDRVLLEPTPAPVRGVRPVLGYSGWGSADPGNRTRQLELGFVPGSLATTFAGSDARTFREPPAGWLPGDPSRGAGLHAGAAHSLLGDLIREGVTGAAGHVAEPYLTSVVKPQILFTAYLSGFNLVESFYLSLPHLSWQAVVIGDPLCAPFPRDPAPAGDLQADVEPGTELPRFFSARRLEVTARRINTSLDALALFVLGETRAMRQQWAEARAAFEKAVQADPALAAAHLELALLDERAADIDAAIGRYRRVIALQPSHVLALNNLAYALAVSRNRPAEAAPHARRAAALDPQNAAVLDTLGWTEHLLGNHAEALRVLATASRLAPNNAEIRLHTALAAAATGATSVAEAELKAALVLQPALAERDDVRRLRSDLATRAK